MIKKDWLKFADTSSKSSDLNKNILCLCCYMYESNIDKKFFKDVKLTHWKKVKYNSCNGTQHWF